MLSGQPLSTHLRERALILSCAPRASSTHRKQQRVPEKEWKGVFAIVSGREVYDLTLPPQNGLEKKATPVPDRLKLNQTLPARALDAAFPSGESLGRGTATSERDI